MIGKQKLFQFPVMHRNKQFRDLFFWLISHLSPSLSAVA